MQINQEKTRAEAKKKFKELKIKSNSKFIKNFYLIMIYKIVFLMQNTAH